MVVFRLRTRCTCTKQSLRFIRCSEAASTARACRAQGGMSRRRGKIDPERGTAELVGDDVSALGVPVGWRDAVRVGDKLYALPMDSSVVLCFCPRTGAASVFPEEESKRLPEGGYKYTGGVLAPNGKISLCVRSSFISNQWNGCLKYLLNGIGFSLNSHRIRIELALKYHHHRTGIASESH